MGIESPAPSTQSDKSVENSPAFNGESPSKGLKGSIKRALSKSKRRKRSSTTGSRRSSILPSDDDEQFDGADENEVTEKEVEKRPTLEPIMSQATITTTMTEESSAAEPIDVDVEPVPGQDEVTLGTSPGQAILNAPIIAKVVEVAQQLPISIPIPAILKSSEEKVEANGAADDDKDKEKEKETEKAEKTGQQSRRSSLASPAAATDKPSDPANDTAQAVDNTDAASVNQTPAGVGYAVASNKRNKDFHSLFKSIPTEDYLIEDYGCALQKDILVHGRIYVSESHLCFHSNILGWVTTLVIAFSEVVSVEKKSIAMLFPNGIQITTNSAKHVFASFISRDVTYDLMLNIWRISHPTAGKDDGATQHSISDNDDDDDDDDEHPAAPIVSLPMTEGEGHAPTECPCLKSGHYDKVLTDETVPLPLPALWNLMFGTDNTFLSKFLSDNQKCRDVALQPWATEDGGKKKREYTYIKPLSGPIGPKQTKCICSEEVEAEDMESHGTVVITTQTPDVPSGSAFSVKTRYCLMWGENNQTRIIVNFNVEWTKSSWVKGPIEKGVADGQANYVKDIINSAKESAGRAGPKAKKAKGAAKGAKGKRKSSSPKAEEKKEEPKGLVATIMSGVEDFGDAIGSLIKALFSAQGIILILHLIIIYMLWGLKNDLRGDGRQSRYARLTEQNEKEIWKWLDDHTHSNLQELGDSSYTHHNVLRELRLSDVEQALESTERKLSILKGYVASKLES